ADGLFRVAELLYQTGRYPEAEAEYRKVLALGGSQPWREAAEYKLGWSLYQQGKYPEALPVFLAILDRYLPHAELSELGPAQAGGAKGKAALTGDALRASLLSFAALGGGKAVNDFFQTKGEPRYSLLIYSALGAELLDKHRYTDAAATYSAYTDRHPTSSIS